jgi:tetratricopeptide (TPR) repeat protein
MAKPNKKRVPGAIATAPPAVPARGNRRRWIVGVAVVVFLTAGAAGSWWAWHRPAAVEPPMPQISDPEIRLVVEKARQGVVDKPNSAAAWGRLGMMLEAHLFEPEADRCFAEAARLDPRDVRWPYFRFLCTPKAQPEKALAFLRQANACSAANEYESAVNFRLAEALLEQQQYDEAEQRFRREMSRGSNQEKLRAAYGLGLIAMARGNTSAAEEFLKIARESPYARRAALAQLAALARARGDNLAAAAMTRESAPRPGDESTWPDPIFQAMANMQVGANVRKQLATQFEAQGNYAAALQIHLQQIEIKPTSDAYISAGLDYAQLSNFDKSLDCYYKAIDMDPDNAQAHYMLAWTQFERAFKERQHSATSSLAQTWFKEAAQHAQQATVLKPDHARGYLIWGLSLRYLEDRKAALEQLRKGVRCSPSDWELQFWLGDTFLENGDVGEAETYLENARKLNPNDPKLVGALERLRQKKDAARQP